MPKLKIILEADEVIEGHYSAEVTGVESDEVVGGNYSAKVTEVEEHLHYEIKECIDIQDFRLDLCNKKLYSLIASDMDTNEPNKYCRRLLEVDLQQCEIKKRLREL